MHGLSPVFFSELLPLHCAGFFLPGRRHWHHPFEKLCSPSSSHSLPEYLLHFILSLGKRSSDRQSCHRTLTWGVTALGLREHIEEVSTETSQGGSSGGCQVVDAALIHQIAVPIACQDCRAGPLPKLCRWLPPSWDPCHRSVYQPVHRGYGLLVGFPRYPLTSDDDALVFLGPCLQGLHHVFR